MSLIKALCGEIYTADKIWFNSITADFVTLMTFFSMTDYEVCFNNGLGNNFAQGIIVFG